MKHLIRSLIVYTLAIAITALFLPGIKYGGQFSTLVFAAITLGIANTFIRPVLSLILLPINIITLGIFGLFMNTILLFIVTLLVPSFDIVPFSVQFGSLHLSFSLLFSYIVCSTILSLVLGIVRDIMND